LIEVSRDRLVVRREEEFRPDLTADRLLDPVLWPTWLAPAPHGYASARFDFSSEQWTHRSLSAYFHQPQLHLSIFGSGCGVIAAYCWMPECGVPRMYRSKVWAVTSTVLVFAGIESCAKHDNPW
jgi:hypothetical protein